jgi:hypothetical protein
MRGTSTCLLVGIEIVPPFSKTVQPSASGYTEVLQGGTISMPTDRHVDNLYYPRLDKNVGF